jgi:hypothetical protein
MSDVITFDEYDLEMHMISLECGIMFFHKNYVFIFYHELSLFFQF